MAVLVDSIFHVFDITNYEEVEGVNNVIVEQFQTPRRKLNWTIQVDPVVQRQNGVFFELTVDLKTLVSGMKIKVSAVLIFGDEIHQRMLLGDRTLTIQGAQQEYGVMFAAALGDPGTALDDALKVPKYRQWGNQSVVRLGVQVEVYKEPVVITLY